MMLLTEFCTGGTLRSRIHNSTNPLTTEARIRYGLQIAQGLSDMHHHAPPIVHRDLKPSNVLLDRYDNAKLCDFGLSHSTLQSALSQATMLEQQVKSSSGTNLYKAPEVWDPRMNKGCESDIYSFGILMHELFCGVIPWADRTSDELMFLHHVLHQSPSVDAELQRQWPHLATLIGNCVLPDPAARPTAAKLVTFFSNLTNGTD